jgi:two-component system nitrate/nitrite response regulator NarL
MQATADMQGVLHDSGEVACAGVVILSDIRFLRESLGEILDRNGALRVLGLCASLAEAVAACRATQPMVAARQAAQPMLVLLDVRVRDAILAVAPLLAAAPGARVVALAVAETQESIIAWAEAGVAGYVPSTAALADLVNVLLGIAQGRQPCSGDVAAGLLRRIAAAGPLAPMPPPAPLTLRERQIVGLIGEGMSNKDIARQLNIGVATVKSHVHNLLAKLNIQRRGQATGWMRDHTA